MRDEQEGTRFLTRYRHGANRGQLSRISGEYLGIQSQATPPCGTELSPYLVEERLCPCRVLAHAALDSFAELEASGGQRDEPLEKIGCPPFSAGSVPKPLPDLVCLPEIPVIKKIDAIQIGTARLPSIRSGLRPELRGVTEAMPGAVAGRMRVVAAHIGVRR